MRFRANGYYFRYTAHMRQLLPLGVALLLCIGCSAGRPPVPPGTVPQQTTLSATDEQYGHDVLSSLTQQYPLDTDDTRINRVRDIADRLAMASGNDQTPWHVHVLKGDSVKNAAATRGNYLFVWSGMFQSVRNDTELATVIAHEMGHVLAGHTAPSAEQEAAQILSGVMGIAAGSALSIQGYGGLSDLAQLLIQNVFEAALLNPQSQADELEADHIGLFLMADAGYDPADALEFWKRVQNDPDFQSASLAFFSSHPSTEERVIALELHMNPARERYRLSQGKAPAPAASKDPSPYSPPETPAVPGQARPADKTASHTPPLTSIDRWMVAEPSISIYAEADGSAQVSGTLKQGEAVSGTLVKKRWVQIVTPVPGFLRSSELSPVK